MDGSACGSWTHPDRDRARQRLPHHGLPGSTQSAEGWRLLIPELEHHGHSVYAVDLPTDRPNADSTYYADAVADWLDTADAGADVVLVAHSASGLFLPLIAERRPVRRMVFVAALVPEIGTSVLEQFQADPGMFNPEWVGNDPQEDWVAEHFLFHDSPPDVLPWALSTRRILYAEGAMTKPCPLTHWPEVPSTYIVCSLDRTIAPSWQRQVARKRLQVEPVELAAGHCPHVTRPRELAEVLARVAA